MPEDIKLAIEMIARAPFSKALGLRIDSAENGVAITSMPFSELLLNAGGPASPIHGGAIASLADFAACAAVWTLAETERSATVAMTVNYAGPGIQSDLVARATVRRYGKLLASVSVEIRNRAGVLVADALVTYKIA